MYTFNPKVVSIGPYHCDDDPKLELGQTLKTRLVQQFASYVENNKKGKYKSLEAYFRSEDFSKVAREARACYAMRSNDVFAEDAFKCLMFVDGCFVVFFIHCIVNKHKDYLQMKNDHIAIIIMDLFLLENQLPYTVLQELVERFMPQNKDNIVNFIKMQTGAKGSRARPSNLYHSVLDILCCKSKVPPPSPSTSFSRKTEPLHLLDSLRTEFLGTESPAQHQGTNEDIIEWQSFRSVEELKAAGINCKVSGSSHIKEIKYERYGHIWYGSLSLPAIVIDNSFKTEWLNLAAYEACLDFFNDSEITSFICFMDSLIDRTEDVKELREKGILQNSIGSDELVAQLFNELATDLTPNPCVYRQVKHDIQENFNNTMAVWFAEVLHTHFRNPWTVLAFQAAMFALILTGVQTYFAIFPRGG